MPVARPDCRTEEASMPIVFTCEQCGRRFQVDDRLQGKRGRCKTCGLVMRIPHPGAAGPENAAGREPEPEPLFRLSPPEPLPQVRREFGSHGTGEAGQEAPAHGALAQPLLHEHHGSFELIDDDVDVAEMPVSPEIKRGLLELAEFEKDRRGYDLVGDHDRGFFSGLRGSRPARWLFVKWRAGVGLILSFLRFIDDWAYLISIPFIMLMVLGIVVANRGFVHTGAVVVVLANYGRFWADLLAIFVRPFKEGPLHGLAFLLPPYTVYYLFTRWNRFKPTLRRMATSCIPIVLVVLAYAYIPEVNPEVKNLQGVRAKLESGVHELRKDIKSDLERLESQLPALELEKRASRPAAGGKRPEPRSDSGETAAQNPRAPD
jgi:hypothetical protein